MGRCENKGLNNPSWNWNAWDYPDLDSNQNPP